MPHRYTVAEYPLAIPPGFLVGRALLEDRSGVCVTQKNLNMKDR